MQTFLLLLGNNHVVRFEWVSFLESAGKENYMLTNNSFLPWVVSTPQWRHVVLENHSKLPVDRKLLCVDRYYIERALKQFIKKIPHLIIHARCLGQRFVGFNATQCFFEHFKNHPFLKFQNVQCWSTCDEILLNHRTLMCFKHWMLNFFSKW